ncbi:DUF6801 domain-containing protein [Actinomadura bangladeshensis]|uniref:DUF6801 domain-containing protein n=1 Tax=Actinomadura bangladeshensis TaxID=453573 RepID=A0A4R4NSN8_9ACTN|nr:DUF6801 domain-containing protein [Actinomadura bangladeshensis]TDC12678.1 hypothetical protein E1284_22655 [Actinomadura bangladeshensis]
MHLMPRTAARVVAIAAVIVSSGTVIAVPPAVADIGTDMRFVCAGETGTHTVGLRIESSVPSSGSVGEPVQLGTIRVEVDLPAELVDQVRVESPIPPVTGATTSSRPSPALGGVAQIRVDVRDDSGERHAGWPAFALAAVPLRGDGTVHLTGSGVAPPVVPRSPGGLSWVAGDFDLSLAPTEQAAKRDEAELSLHCAADKGAVLGSVRVQRESQTPALNAQNRITRQAAAPEKNVCEEIPGSGADPRYAINPDPTLMKIYDEPQLPDGLDEFTDAGLAQCVSAAGFVNIRKSRNAVPLAASSVLRRGTTAYQPSSDVPNYAEQRGYAVNRTDPLPGTVLGFGFMPTRAVAEAVQVKAPGAGKNDPITGNFRFIAPNYPDHVFDATQSSSLKIASYVRVKASAAQVNGVPINLGQNCTTRPTVLNVHAFLGNRETGLRPPTVGQTLIAEDLKIPEFSGCGVTEDLSPLLTASISGGGNYVKAEAGGWCYPGEGGGCVDGAAPPPATLTIRPGGDITAVAEPFILRDVTRRAQVSCASATMRFHLDPQHWRAGFMLARAGMSFENCEIQAQDRTVYPAELTLTDSLWLNAVEFQPDGSLWIQATNALFVAATEVNGTKCTLRFSKKVLKPPSESVDSTGEFKLSYYSDGSMSSYIGPDFLTSPESTCNIPGFRKNLRLGQGTADFVVHPRQEITTP